MSPIQEAVTRGISRGSRLAMNPTRRQYRVIKTSQEDSVKLAWKEVGLTISQAMKRQEPTR